MPGSLGNVGSGFDCLGLALSIRNRISMEIMDRPGISIEVIGEGTDSIPRDETNFVVRAAERIFELAGCRISGLAITLQNGIPLARGLGSSGAAAVAGMACANALIESPFPDSELVEMAAEFEGHPDNVVPSVCGGFTISMWISKPGGKQLLYDAFPVPGNLSVVAAVPTFTLETKKARQVLPDSYPRHAVVHNLARTSWAVRCFMKGDFSYLAEALDDQIHQPFRSVLVPGFNLVKEAALKNGALAACLSGAGPTVAAFYVEANGDRIGSAMMEAFSSAGVGAGYRVLEPDNRGLEVTLEEV